jgi:hypothetical protein
VTTIPALAEALVGDDEVAVIEKRGKTPGAVLACAVITTSNCCEEASFTSSVVEGKKTVMPDGSVPFVKVNVRRVPVRLASVSLIEVVAPGLKVTGFTVGVISTCACASTGARCNAMISTRSTESAAMIALRRWKGLGTRIAQSPGSRTRQPARRL